MGDDSSRYGHVVGTLRWGGEAEGLVVSLETVDGAAQLTLTGELDAHTAPFLTDAVDQVGAGAPDRIVVDLAQVSFIDSAGLGGLLRVRNAAVESGVPFTVANRSDVVNRLIELTGLEELLGPA
jgi:anti-anti-sigma factor